jgi:hypothetical protein
MFYFQKQQTSLKTRILLLSICQAKLEEKLFPFRSRFCGVFDVWRYFFSFCVNFYFNTVYFGNNLYDSLQAECFEGSLHYSLFEMEKNINANTKYERCAGIKRKQPNTDIDQGKHVET